MDSVLSIPCHDFLLFSTPKNTLDVELAHILDTFSNTAGLMPTASSSDDLWYYGPPTLDDIVDLDVISGEASGDSQSGDVSNSETLFPDRRDPPCASLDSPYLNSPFPSPRQSFSCPSTPKMSVIPPLTHSSSSPLSDSLSTPKSPSSRPQLQSPLWTVMASSPYKENEFTANLKQERSSSATSWFNHMRWAGRPGAQDDDEVVPASDNGWIAPGNYLLRRKVSNPSTSPKSPPVASLEFVNRRTSSFSKKSRPHDIDTVIAQQFIPTEIKSEPITHSAPMIPTIKTKRSYDDFVANEEVVYPTPPVTTSAKKIKLEADDSAFSMDCSQIPRYIVHWANESEPSYLDPETMQYSAVPQYQSEPPQFQDMMFTDQAPIMNDYDISNAYSTSYTSRNEYPPISPFAQIPQYFPQTPRYTLPPQIQSLPVLNPPAGQYHVSGPLVLETPKPKKKSKGRRHLKDLGLFVNYTASDAVQLLSGVAPSGNGKTKGDRQDKARRGSLAAESG